MDNLFFMIAAISKDAPRLLRAGLPFVFKALKMIWAPQATLIAKHIYLLPPTPASFGLTILALPVVEERVTRPGPLLHSILATGREGGVSKTVKRITSNSPC